MSAGKCDYKVIILIEITKKLCSVILTVAIVFSLFIFSFAAENVIVYSGNINAVAGQTISVPVRITNNKGFMGFSIILEFDDTVFTPVSVSAGDMLLNGSIIDSIGGTMESNIVKVVYTDSSVVTGNGILFNVNFNVSENASGNQSVKLSYVPTDTFDGNFDFVKFTCEDFSIFVENDYVENAVKFEGDSHSVNAGDILNVPISVKDAVGMSSFELDIVFNEKSFEFLGYNSGEILKGENAALIENTSSLTFSWTGSLVTENGNLLYLSFKVAEYIEKQEELLLSCKNVTFSDGFSKQSVCSNAKITIRNPHINEPAFIYSDSFISIENNYIDVPVYINNNHGVMGLGIDIAYATTVVKPVSATRGDILSSGNFEDNIESSSGNIKIRWNNTEDIYDNGLLFTVRFEILNNATLHTVPIEFVYLPSDTYNEKWEDVALDVNIDTVSVRPEYTIRFIADGVVVSSQKFNSDTNVDEIVLPSIPSKDGYTGKWDKFYLDVNKDVDVKCVYTPIQYTATFVSDGKVIGTDNFTVEDDSFNYPYVAKKLHYDWVWDEQKIELRDLTIEGRYVPITYTITFVSNGKTVKTQKYNVNTVDTIVAPQKSLPAKQHYTVEWEEWKGKIGNLTVNEIYVPVKYKISFYCQNKLIDVRTYTIETSESQLIPPKVPIIDGYSIEWPDISFEYKDQTVSAICTLKVYTAQFIVNGTVIDTQTFTVETDKLNEPPIPQKAGYIASWSAYNLKAGDLIINAKYCLPEVIMKAKETMDVDETARLFAYSNFDTTEKIWHSSNPEIAVVDEHGSVTTVNTGKCEIIVICYGLDSCGNEIKTTNKTEIVVKEKINSETFKEWFRAAFDEFFEVRIYDILENFKKFMIVLFRQAG